jgi:hypothetical protein
MEIKIVLPLLRSRALSLGQRKLSTTMIQKSELQQVPVEQRVPGRIYGVADSLDNELLRVAIFDNGCMSTYGEHAKYWFALPESLLPTKEVLVMPEIGKEYEFSDDGKKWYKDTLKRFCTNRTNWQYLRPIQTMPSLFIPQGTKQEQIMALESLLNELKK